MKHLLKQIECNLNLFMTSGGTPKHAFPCPRMVPGNSEWLCCSNCQLTECRTHGAAGTVVDKAMIGNAVGKSSSDNLALAKCLRNGNINANKSAVCNILWSSTFVLQPLKYRRDWRVEEEYEMKRVRK